MKLTVTFKCTKTGKIYEHIDKYFKLSDFEDVEEMKHNMVYQYTEGNYGCDCNRDIFAGVGYGDNRPCGESRYELLELMTEDGDKLDIS